MTEERVSYAGTAKDEGVKNVLRDGRTKPIFIHSSIDDMTFLTPNAKCVYMHLARRADNKKGNAWPSYQSIGDHCFSSVYNHPDTRRRHAISAVEELIKAGLISKTTRDRGGFNVSNEYELLDVVIAQSQPVVIAQSQPVVIAQSQPVVIAQSQPVVIAQSHKGTPIEGTPIEGTPIEGTVAQQETPEPASQQEMFGAICEALGWDYRTLKPKSRKEVGDAAVLLRKAGYTIEDIRSFMVDIWFKDWRWTKYQQLPTINLLCEDIGKLRSVVKDIAPKTPKTGIDGFRELARRNGVEL